MSSQQFKTGDKVLCFHQGHYYDAKCIATKLSPDGENMYRIHYIGWKPKWDEWISEKADRIKEHNEENVKARDALKERKGRQKRSKKTKAKGSDDNSRGVAGAPGNEVPTSEDVSSTVNREADVPTPTADDIVNQTNPTAMDVDNSANIAEATLPTETAKIIIPIKVEQWLVDDFYQINNLKKLPVVPANPTVHTILEDYQKHMIQNSPSSEHAHISKFVAAMEELFNTSCGSRLIYNYEHPHYRDNTQEFAGMPLSHVYGFPHLLRLFHVVRHILEVEPLKNIGPATEDIDELLNYLSQRGEEIFVIVNLYEVASAEYTRLAQQAL